MCLPSKLSKCFACSSTYALLFLSLIVLAQENITVDNTFPSIQYSPANTTGSWIPQGPANLANNPAEAYIASCYNKTLNSAKGTASANFTFIGSALYLQSLLYSAGDQMLVTLDNQIYPPIDLYDANQTTSVIVFSQENLDATSSHTLVVQKYNASSNLYVNIDAIIYTALAGNTTPSASPPGATLQPSPLPSSSGSTKPRTTHKFPLGAIVGIVVAGVLIIAGLCFWFYRQGRARAQANAAESKLSEGRESGPLIRPSSDGLAIYSPGAASYARHGRSDPQMVFSERATPTRSRLTLGPIASGSPVPAGTGSPLLSPECPQSEPQNIEPAEHTKGRHRVRSVQSDSESVPPPQYEP